MLIKIKEALQILKIYFKKHRVIVGLVLIVIVVLVGGIMLVKGANYEREGVKIIDSNSVKEEKKVEGNMVVFDIEGAVSKPGVYKLKEGSVVAEAIEAAGGFNSEADRERVSREINQAAVVANNSKIYIFTLKDREVKIVSNNTNPVYTAESLNASANSSVPSKGKININSASLQELDSLPKIGPVLAQRIIDWRDANGGFEIVEDIKKVKGIGDSVFEEIKGLIEVE